MLTKTQTLAAIQKSLIKYNDLVANQIDSKINAHNTIASATANGHMSSNMVTKLNGIADGAEVNQNAISKIQIGDNTVAAAGKESTATFKGSNGVSVSFDKDNAIEISGADAVGAANKVSSDLASYKTTVANTYMPKSGGTFTGIITLSGAPTSNLHAVTKKYVDDKVTGLSIGNYMPKSGGTFTGAVTLAAAPTTDLQAATKKYVDDAAAAAAAKIVDSAPDTLNTLNLLAEALGDDPKFATTIATQIGAKVDKVDGKGLSTNDYTTSEKNKLKGIASGAEVNQNAFATIAVKVGTTTTNVEADAKQDVLTLSQGDNITLTPNATNDTITIAAKDTTYTTSSPISLSGTTISHATSGASAGSYGDNANQTPAYGATFKVPYLTVNNTGHVTSISEHTVKIPASNNTDTKMNVTLNTKTKAYLVGVSTAPTATAKAFTGIADTGVYLDAAAGSLTATTFNGALSGNATSASKVNNQLNIVLKAVQGGTSTLYDGSSAQTVIINPSNIGAASENHTHSQYENPNSYGLIHIGDKSISATGTDDVIDFKSGDGINISFGSSDATTSSVLIANAGVRSISSGSTNGTISVNTGGTVTNVAVKGLGSAAYTASTAYASSSHTHKYAGSSSAGGTATEAAKTTGTLTIQTNGTSAGTFNGSANKTINITPANIGAATSNHTHSGYAASSHSHGLLNNNFAKEIIGSTGGWELINSTNTGYLLTSLRGGSSVPVWFDSAYSSGIIFGGSDTKGVLSVSYSEPSITFAGGDSSPTWHMKITGSNNTTYNLNNYATNSVVFTIQNNIETLQTDVSTLKTQMGDVESILREINGE